MRIISPYGNYKIKDSAPEQLRKLGFYYDGTYENPTYSYRFPVHKDRKITTLECILTVDVESRMIVTNVYMTGNFNGGMERLYYPPYYLEDPGVHKNLINGVDKRIKEIFDLFEISVEN